MPNNFNFQWKIENAKNAVKTGEIYIYSTIGDYQYIPEDITATSFKNDLEALGDIKQLNVYINSPGGSPFVAVAIMNIVDRCKKKNNFTVTTFNDGLAASAASLILMMGDKIVIPSNAITMIHRAWTIAIGNANDFRKMVKELDTVDESLVSVYQTKNKALSKDEIMELLDNETWMSAQDAIDYGFEVEIGEEKQVAACIKDDKLFAGETGFDIKSFGFKNFPADKFPKIVDDVVPEDILKNIGPDDGQEKAKNFIFSVIMEALETNEGSLRDTLKNLSEQKPEKEPTQSSGFFDTQKYADKISQLVERRKKHE